MLEALGDGVHSAVIFDPAKGYRDFNNFKNLNELMDIDANVLSRARSPTLLR